MDDCSTYYDADGTPHERARVPGHAYMATGKDGYCKLVSDGTPTADAEVVLYGGQTGLMQPPDDVWGSYKTTEDSWCATYHFPSGTRVMGFYVLPAMTKEATDAMVALGISADDAPLALFSGLVSEKLKCHRDNEDVLKQGWDMMVNAYKGAVTGDMGTAVASVIGSAMAASGAERAPIMKLDERMFTLWPDKYLFRIALDRVREAFVNRTSLAETLAFCRDIMSTSGEARKRLDRLARIHAANEFLARYALLGEGVNDSTNIYASHTLPVIQSFAIAQGLDVEAARDRLLQLAGASGEPLALPTQPLHLTHDAALHALLAGKALEPHPFVDSKLAPRIREANFSGTAIERERRAHPFIQSRLDPREAARELFGQTMAFHERERQRGIIGIRESGVLTPQAQFGALYVIDDCDPFYDYCPPPSAYYAPEWIGAPGGFHGGHRGGGGGGHHGGHGHH